MSKIQFLVLALEKRFAADAKLPCMVTSPFPTIAEQFAIVLAPVLIYVPHEMTYMVLATNAAGRIFVHHPERYMTDILPGTQVLVFRYLVYAVLSVLPPHHP
ncbi:MAG: hypothetical protein WCG98_00600 [bacterium]